MFKIFFFIIVSLIGTSFGNPYISVNLTNYLFTTSETPKWKMNDNTDLVIEVPISLEFLEFQCVSNFPTKWILSLNPLVDRTLTGIPKVLKSRSNHTGGMIFYSNISFNFKPPIVGNIQHFSCFSTDRNINQGILIFASVKSQNSNPFLSYKLMKSIQPMTTKNKYGINTDCGLKLEVDFANKLFSCSHNGIKNLIPQIISCSNPDECDFVVEPYSKYPCQNPLILNSCKDVGCSSFQPRTLSGAIVCGNGSANSLAVKYSIWNEENSNVSKLVPLDETNADPEKFLHILDSNSSKIVYNNQPVFFICKASPFFFSKGFQWKLRNTDGISHLLDEDNEEVLIVNGTYIVNKTIIFNMTKYGEVNNVRCEGSVWNSITTQISYQLVEMKGSREPSIEEANTTITRSSGNVTLNCTYSGKPLPTNVTWRVWGRLISTMDEDFRILDSSKLNKSQSQLIIIDLQKLAKEGRRLFRMTCSVENFLAVEERLFIINFEQQSLTNTILLASVITLLFIIIILVLFGWLYMKWMRKRDLEYVKKDIQLFLEGDPNLVASDEKDLSAISKQKPYDTDLEISLANMEIERKNPLGAGAYGLVLKGIVEGGRCGVQTDVAIKTVRSNVDPSYFKSLLTELKVMLYIGLHENIVNLLGACTEKIYDMELYIVLELCRRGELEKYLKTHRLEFTHSLQNKGRSKTTEANSSRLESWCYQISNGMEYLASKKVIHGDLATRNVLLTEELSAKLCDFGLSRQLYQYTQYVKKNQAPLPWRWMSIESLRDMEFSSESDVWSYGVTLWEIYSFGEVPYPAQTWTNEFLKNLINGVRLQQPESCPDEIYQIMKKCWSYDPKDRPMFRDLKRDFHK